MIVLVKKRLTLKKVACVSLFQKILEDLVEADPFFQKKRDVFLLIQK
jgi:hypothetical protein